MRRRLRRQRQVREALLLDLGALVFELQRQGRREPELLQAKAAELSGVDEEVRALSGTLDAQGTVLQLTAGGIAGSCSQCAAIMPVDARYCASCGASAQVALSSAAPDHSAALDSAQPSAETPSLTPQEAESSEVGTEERAALEAGESETETTVAPEPEPEATVAPEPEPEAEATVAPEPEPTVAPEPEEPVETVEPQAPEPETSEPEPEPAEDQPTKTWAPAHALQPGTQKPPSRARAWLRRRRG